ncbi:MAG: fused MFS/spermidine synthase, partial [Myxococcota bacterium]
GFWLVPTLGLVGVLRLAAFLNLTAGAAFVALDRRAPSSSPLEATPRSPRTPEPAKGDTPETPHPRQRPDWLWPGVALLIGFAMMTVQTVLIRLGGLAFGSSQFTFSMVVAVFVLCIALGSFGVSALPRIPPSLLVVTLWALVGLLGLLYLRADEAPYWAHVLRSLFEDHAAAFYPYTLSAFVAVLAIIGPAVVLSGATLPLIFHHQRHQVNHLGDVAGRIYSWNTVGSLLGALLSGYALLFWLDLDDVFRIGLGAAAIAAIATTSRALNRRGSVAWALIPGLLAIAWMPDWSPERLSSGLFRHRAPRKGTYEAPGAIFDSLGNIKFYTDDPTASVAVYEVRDSDGILHRSILNNGKSDGDMPGDYVTMALAGLLPALFAAQPERAFVIGLGTGVTAGELGALDEMREVVVAEISDGVIAAAPFFDFGNQNVTQNPKIRIVRGDAYRTLRRSGAVFNVIASEPSNPWVTGVEMLFSREFLEIARNHLAPGGVYAQWFHLYETDTDTVSMVFRTYATVFDHVAVWYATGSDLLLLGFRDPDLALDVARLAKRSRRRDFAMGLRRCGIQTVAALLAHELLPLGVINATPFPGVVHSLLHPRLNHIAAKAFFRGGGGSLPNSLNPTAARVGASNSLVRRFAAMQGGFGQNQWQQLVAETCEYRGSQCLTLLAEWTVRMPKSRARQRIIAHIRENQILSDRTRLSLLEPLSLLYGDGGEEAENPLKAANEATDRFIRYYHHSAPFDRQHLTRLWRRCEKNSGQPRRCDRARARAEKTLGPL